MKKILYFILSIFCYKSAFLFYGDTIGKTSLIQDHYANFSLLEIFLKILFFDFTLLLCLFLIVILIVSNQIVRFVVLWPILFGELLSPLIVYFNNAPIDYSLLANNKDIIFTYDFFSLIGTLKPTKPILFFSLNLTLFSYFLFKILNPHFLINTLNQLSRVKKKSMLVVVISGYFALLPFSAPLFSAKEYFFKTFYESYTSSRAIYQIAKTFPLYQKSLTLDPNPNPNPNPNPLIINPREKPHVFIIFIESFNQFFANRANEDGIIITPFFNSLIQKGLYIETFYNLSVQTIRGQISTLCGIVPSYKAKISFTYPNLRLNCLSSIFKKEGYNTFFFKAHSNIHFDNTFHFFKKRHFDHVYGMDQSFINEEDRPYIWGWGLQDDKFYEKFFNYLDQQKQKFIGKDFLVFASLTTVSNHTLFNQVPQEKRYIYKEAITTFQHYNNTLYLTDLYLKTFFRELHKRSYLKNSLVIITGDHSYPITKAKSEHSTKGHRENSFRTPLLVLWPNKIAPRVIKNMAFSQTDIAPSLLDLLKINTDHHYIGKSFFKSEKEMAHTPQHDIYVSQPYDGTYLSVIRYPFRYILHKTSKKEFLYNLEKDSKESLNLINKPSYQGILSELRKKLEFFDLNQELIHSDLFIPPTQQEESYDFRYASGKH